jgi:hypothetical protein
MTSPGPSNPYAAPSASLDASPRRRRYRWEPVLAIFCGLLGVGLIGVAAASLILVGWVIEEGLLPDHSEVVGLLGTSGLLVVSGLSILVAAVGWSRPRYRAARVMMVLGLAAAVGALAVAQYSIAWHLP